MCVHAESARDECGVWDERTVWTGGVLDVCLLRWCRWEVSREIGPGPTGRVG